MSAVTTRALRLLSLLQSRTVWTGPELAEEMGVTARTVRRDVDRLREMGYPVLTSAGHGGGYQLGVGRALPPLLLGVPEATAVSVGLRMAARSGVEGLDEDALRALALIERFLPPTVRSEISALSEAVDVIAGPAPTMDSEVLLTAAAAVRDGVRLRLDHERADGHRAERRLEPYRILSVERRWYLFAWDLDREDWRTFRLDRVHAATASTLTFTRRETPDIERTVRESIALGPYRGGITVRLLAPAAQVEPLVPLRSATITPDGEDACILRAGMEDPSWVAMHLARLGIEMEVIDPPELLEVIERMGRWAQQVRPAR